jgi:hypothetical protein
MSGGSPSFVLSSFLFPPTNVASLPLSFLHLFCFPLLLWRLGLILGFIFPHVLVAALRFKQPDWLPYYSRTPVTVLTAPFIITRPPVPRIFLGLLYP